MSRAYSGTTTGMAVQDLKKLNTQLHVYGIDPMPTLVSANNTYQFVIKNTGRHATLSARERAELFKQTQLEWNGRKVQKITDKGATGKIRYVLAKGIGTQSAMRTHTKDYQVVPTAFQAQVDWVTGDTNTFALEYLILLDE